MEVKNEHKQRIEQIINTMECRKDFECYKSEFENLSKVRDLGIEGFIECLEKTPQVCNFSIPFGNTHFCKCPLRIYVAKNLNR